MSGCPLLVFADDWGRHPSSCQHLIRQLLEKYPTWWVNTIGTRRPRLDWATMVRGLGKVRQWMRPTSRARTAINQGGVAASGGSEDRLKTGLQPAGDDGLPGNLRVLNPRMWPSFGSRLGRWLNRRLLVRQLTAVIGSMPEPPVAVTTLPIVADLMGELPVRRWVYYCVDDFSEWPGLDAEPLRHMEKIVVQRADTLIAVSQTLQEKLSGMGRQSYLLTHGVDLDFWSKPGPQPFPSLAGLERPLVVFWGVIDRRMDVGFVRHLAKELERGTIILAGPEADPDPALFAADRIVRLESLPFEQLPRLAREAGVLIMPYADLPVTRAMQPLKLKEYLATGKPAVVRRLPATHSWADCLDLTDTPESFAQAVRRRLREGLSPGQRSARARLAEESWAEKVRVFECWALMDKESGFRNLDSGISQPAA